MKEEGPVQHFAIIKLASLDIIASFALTIGFSIIGSGMYQVIYSSIVVWCAIFTWLFMGRALSWIQWIAIIGTSVGLGISSLDSIRGSPLQTDAYAESTTIQTDQKGIWFLVIQFCENCMHLHVVYFRIHKKCIVEWNLNDNVWHTYFGYKASV